MIPDYQINDKSREVLIGLLHQRLSKVRFISPKQVRALRNLTRYRNKLLQEYNQQLNYLQKVLKTVTIKPSSIFNSILSTSRQEQVVGTTGVEDNHQAQTKLAHGYNKANLQELYQALEERVPTHQYCLIISILSHMDFLEETIQNVQMAMKRCILSPDETIHPLNPIPTASQIEHNGVFSNNVWDELENALQLVKLACTFAAKKICASFAKLPRSGSPLTSFTPNVHRSTDINRLAYEKHPIPRTRLNPGNRQGRSKWISDKTIQGVRLCKLAQSIIGQDKDPFLSAFSHYKTDRLQKKQAIIPLTDKWLINSYQTLKNNKYHHKLALDHYNQPNLIQEQQNHGYSSGQIVMNCIISICLMAGLALISHSPFVFPSLGPTIFLFFYKPTDPSSSPRNTLIGHSIAILAGYFSLVVTGLTAAGPVFAIGVTWPRIIAIGLSLGLTVGLMTLLRAPHPPATATTLLISLGTLTKPWQLIVLMLAVVLLTMQASIINYLTGIDYHYPELKDCVQSGKKPLLKPVFPSFRLLPHTAS
jgi:CBS domain-containing membrane protein